jgi:hypothetical protein
MSADWRNKVGNGGQPYVVVECFTCKGSSLIEKPVAGMKFSHCGIKEEIPESVVQTYLSDLAELQGKPSGYEKGRVRWLA